MSLMTRGDAGYIPLKIKTVDMADVASIEFTVHNISKNYCADGSGEVAYDSENKVFNFPITQAETLALPDTEVGLQARVMFVDNFKVQATKISWVSIDKVLREGVMGK